MKEKKLTLPLIHAFSKAPSKDRKAVLRLLKSGVKDDDVASIVEFVNANGGIEYARTKAEEFRDRALEALEPFPESACRTSLQDFARFVIERSK